MVDDRVEDGPDNLPGGEESLARLHLVVPMSQEIDIVEEAGRAESRRITWEMLCARFSLEDDSVRGADDDPDVELDEVWPDTSMSFGQVVGMLEHLLGAEVIDDGGTSGTADEE